MLTNAGLFLPAGAQSTPRRAIVYIGDGAGVSYWTAAAIAADNLAVEQFRVVGLVNTESSDSKVTDSAAAATAFASGVRTYRGAIGVNPDTVPVPNVLERAKDRGMATGLIATSSITHATPAAFAAHTPSRQMHFEIAKQMVELEVDVLLGGGRAYFDASRRPDGRDLITELRNRGAYAGSESELRALNLARTQRLTGLFVEDHLPTAPRRSPSLPDMTAAALDVLDRDPDGFFLMVESSQPDWLGHDNEPLDALVAEMLDFDASIRKGLEYQAQNPETLILVLGDHETGGLAIELLSARRLLRTTASELDTLNMRLRETAQVFDGANRHLIDSTMHFAKRASALLRARSREVGSAEILVGRYTGGGHTAEHIPLFASGPGADRFGGLIENWQVGQLLLNFVDSGFHSGR